MSDERDDTDDRAEHDDRVDAVVDDDPRKWCTLQGAARATARSVNTLLRWIDESYELPRDERPLAERAYFTEREARQTTQRVGKGRAWHVELDALARVHRARGGDYWNAHAAHAVAALPLAVVEERRVLLERLAARERELDTLRHELAVSYARAVTPLSRVKKPTAKSPPAPTSDMPELDASWEPFSAWARRHALDYRTAQRLRYSGILPATMSGAWVKHGAHVKEAYTAEQRLAADAALARWQHGDKLRDERLDAPLVERLDNA